MALLGPASVGCGGRPWGLPAQGELAKAAFLAGRSHRPAGLARRPLPLPYLRDTVTKSCAPPSLAVAAGSASPAGCACRWSRSSCGGLKRKGEGGLSTFISVYLLSPSSLFLSRFALASDSDISRLEVALEEKGARLNRRRRWFSFKFSTSSRSLVGFFFSPPSLLPVLSFSLI